MWPGTRDLARSVARNARFARHPVVRREARRPHTGCAGSACPGRVGRPEALGPGVGARNAARREAAPVGDGLRGLPVQLCGDDSYAAVIASSTSASSGSLPGVRRFHFLMANRNRK